MLPSYDGIYKVYKDQGLIMNFINYIMNQAGKVKVIKAG